MNTIEFSFRVSAFVFNLWSPGGSFMVQKIVYNFSMPVFEGEGCPKHRRFYRIDTPFADL